MNFLPCACKSKVSHVQFLASSNLWDVKSISSDVILVKYYLRMLCCEIISPVATRYTV